MNKKIPTLWAQTLKSTASTYKHPGANKLKMVSPTLSRHLIRGSHTQQCWQSFA